MLSRPVRTRRGRRRLAGPRKHALLGSHCGEHAFAALPSLEPPTRSRKAAKAIHVERDQAVKAGDVIAEVASLELQDLQLELLRSHLKLELLQQTLERLRPLAEQGGPALTRRQWREAAAAAAQMRKDSLRKRLLAIGLVAGQVDAVLATRTIAHAVPVRAPRAGVVVSLRTALGQAVKAEDSLIEIHDPTGALVRGYVSERQPGGVFVHQRARVRLTAEPDWVGEGEVVQSSQEFLTADRTLSVWVRLKEPPSRPIRHGQFAQLTLLGEESEPVLAVPRDAVLREGSAEFVFVRQANGVFDRRPVATGRANDLWSELIQGVEPGEDVATRGVQELQTGHSALR